MLFSKNKKVNREVAPESQLKIEVEVRIKKTNTTYNQAKTVAHLKIDENMVLTTDAPLKALKNEVESILTSVYDKVSDQIEASPDLSDGAHQKKAEEDGSPLAQLEGDND